MRSWGLTSDGTWAHTCGHVSFAVFIGDKVLNIFQGGPKHNTIVETAELAKTQGYGWVMDYKWTPDTITGSQSGRVARVWVYNEEVQNT